MPGTMAERVLPPSSSLVRMGEASTASRLLVCFSPTIENVAMDSGTYAGRIRKSDRNCWRL